MKIIYNYYTIKYGSVGHKWEFQWPGNQSLLVACKGRAMADKVARIVAGSLKRSDNKLDGLARANITQVITPRSE